MEEQRQDQHKRTRSGEESSLGGCSVPVTSVHATDCAEALAFLSWQGTFIITIPSGMFLVTQFLWTRGACAATIFSTPGCAALGTQPQVSHTAGRVQQCLANSFTCASLSKKWLALPEKAFCTSAPEQLFSEESLQETALELPPR